MAQGDIRRTPQVVGKGGVPFLRSLNENLRLIWEAINGLLGRAGPVVIRDSVTVLGTATVNGAVLPNNIPAVKLVNTTQPSIPNDTFTTMTWDTESFDTDNMYDPAVNNRITINTAGNYIIGGSIRWQPDVDGVRTVDLLRFSLGTSTSLVESSMSYSEPNNGFPSAAFSVLIQCKAGDYLQLRVYQNGGAALATFNSFFWAHRIS